MHEGSDVPAPAPQVFPAFAPGHGTEEGIQLSSCAVLVSVEALGTDMHCPRAVRFLLPY